jgi:hypothetical protein
VTDDSAENRGLRSPKGVTKPARPRRQRSTTESLLSIVLILEAVLLFFATLTIFGLKALPAPTALLGGGAFILVIVIASGLQRYRWGVWLGWVLQAAILALGFIIPIMFIVGAGFVALWVYCFLKARDLDRQRAAIQARLAAEAEAEADAAEPSTQDPSPAQGENP